MVGSPYPRRIRSPLRNGRRRMLLGISMMGLTVITYTSAMLRTAHRLARTDDLSAMPLEGGKEAWLIGFPLSGVDRIEQAIHKVGESKTLNDHRKVNVQMVRGSGDLDCDDTRHFRLGCWRHIGSHAVPRTGFDQRANISVAVVVIEHPLATMSRAFLQNHDAVVSRQYLMKFCRLLDGAEGTEFPCESWIERTVEWYNRALETPEALNLDTYVWHSAWWGADEESQRMPQLEEILGAKLQPPHAWFPSDVSYLKSLLTKAEILALDNAYERTASERVREQLDMYTS